MKTTAIVSRKGGAGKTTTAHALGAGLMREGYKVLFVDLDSQRNLSYSLGADLNGLSSMDVLTGRAGIRAAIQHTPQGDVVPAAISLAGADIAIDGKGKEYRLKKALETVRGAYNYAIIDTPAALGTLTINALAAAHNVVIPVQAETYSLQGLAELNAAINAVKKRCNPVLHVNGILITRHNPRTILAKDMQASFEEAARRMNTRVFSTPIRESTSIKEAQARQTDIYSYSRRSNAAKDYSTFIKEFVQDCQ